MCLSVALSLSVLSVCVCVHVQQEEQGKEVQILSVCETFQVPPPSLFFSLFLTFFLLFQPHFSPKVRGKRLWISHPPTPARTNLLMAPLVSNPCESVFSLGGTGAPCTTAPKMNTSQSRRAPPHSQVLCFGGTGPIHSPLIKHLPPPVPRRKNPTVKSTSSSLRPLSALLCLSLLSVRRKVCSFP